MSGIADIQPQFSEVYTGQPEASVVGQYRVWKNFEEIRCCEHPPCKTADATDCYAWETEAFNKIQGGDCSLFGPMLDLGDGSKLNCWTEETNRRCALY